VFGCNHRSRGRVRIGQRRVTSSRPSVSDGLLQEYSGIHMRTSGGMRCCRLGASNRDASSGSPRRHGLQRFSTTASTMSALGDIGSRDVADVYRIVMDGRDHLFSDVKRILSTEMENSKLFGPPCKVVPTITPSLTEMLCSASHWSHPAGLRHRTARQPEPAAGARLPLFNVAFT
jgi:hypothetical protein